MKGLVVTGVDVGAAADQVEQAAVFINGNVVGRQVARSVLSMLERLFGVFRKVLVDRPSQSNVDQLHPPANTHDRLVCGQGLL